MGGRQLVLMVGLLLGFAGVPAVAGARDALAPAGASDHWLPREDWVYRHWLPFAAVDATRELGLGRGELEAFLFDDRRTLVQLARAEGLDPGALRDRLVAPAIAGLADPQRVATVRSRAWRMLTQGHLAQHLLFHPYHGLDVRAAASLLFGIGPKAYWRARLRGATPLQLAQADGSNAGELTDAMDGLFAVDHDEGLRLQVTSPAAAAERVALQQAELPCWERRAIPGKDPGQPYVEQHKIPGRTLLPRTAAQLHADERILERYRRALPRSCWVLPRAYDGPAVAAPRASDPDTDPSLRGFIDPATPADQAVPRFVCTLGA